MSKKQMISTLNQMTRATTEFMFNTTEAQGYKAVGIAHVVRAYAREINRIMNAAILFNQDTHGLDIERLGEDVHDILFERGSFEHPTFDDNAEPSNYETIHEGSHHIPGLGTLDHKIVAINKNSDIDAVIAQLKSEYPHIDEEDFDKIRENHKLLNEGKKVKKINLVNVDKRKAD